MAREAIYATNRTKKEAREFDTNPQLLALR